LRRSVLPFTAVRPMHLGERLVHVLHQIPEFTIQGCRPADNHIIEVWPGIHRRDATHGLFQPPARPVASDGTAALSTLRTLLRDGMPRDSETKTRPSAFSKPLGPGRSLQHESRCDPAPTRFQPDKVPPVFQCCQPPHGHACRFASWLGGARLRRQSLALAHPAPRENLLAPFRAHARAEPVPALAPELAGLKAALHLDLLRIPDGLWRAYRIASLRLSRAAAL